MKFMSDYIVINEEYAPLLKRHGLTDLKRLLQWSAGDLVGEHDGRKTWRTTLDDPDGQSAVYYIRQEHKIPLGEIAEDLSRFGRPASRGLKTLQATELFTSAGINVAPLCAVIERRCLNLPTRAVAVQAHVAGQDIYHELLTFGRPGERKRNTPARRRLLCELGSLLSKMTQARIYWPDLVAKHLFVQAVPGPSPRWRITLIDVERAEKTLNPKKRNHQFKHLLKSLRGLLTMTDLIRIARGYLSPDSVPPRSVRRSMWQKYFPLGMDWIRATRQEMIALSAMPDDQPLPEEELYERVGNFTINMRFKEPLRNLGLLEKNAVFTFEQGSELHKPGLGRRFRMRFETILAGRRIWLYLKRVRHPKISDQIDRLLCGTVRHSLAWHERYMIKLLGQNRIPAPGVVGYAEKMLLSYEVAGALITQGLIGQSLEKYVPKHFSRTPDREELGRRRDWIRRLAYLIRRFHHAGFCHRDLYLAHIFIAFKKNGDPIFFMIDLARVFKMNWRKERWIVKDLGALNYSSPQKTISYTDRMRFFKVYLGVKKLGKPEKKFLRKILKKSRRIARHDTRHPKTTGERSLS